jgi:hypothetical protein
MPGAEVRVNLSPTFPAPEYASGADDAKPRRDHGAETVEDVEQRNW